MSHAIFQTTPWLTGPIRLPGEPVGMLGHHEAMFFHCLAKTAFTGRGTIVDAGSFLGKSAYYFAQGLRANPVFDSKRDRVHCFDNFLVNEENTVDFIHRSFGETLRVGDSTRAIFERQVAPVRDLLEVHEGDFHTVPWQAQPIEILMIDLAKSESLGKRVVEAFFPDLMPGLSTVIHQDYHHHWLPHLHVVMEYFADYFEIVVPRVDSSAAFMLTKAIPEHVLHRAIAYDFSFAEQLALMDRAVARLPAGDQHFVELARLTLRARSNDSLALRVEFDGIEHRRDEQKRDPTWLRYLEEMRDFVDVSEGWQQRSCGNFTRALELADGLVARGRKSSNILVMRATALVGLGRHAEAEPVLREALRFPQPSGYAYTELSRVLIKLGRPDEAEAELVRGLFDRTAVGTQPLVFLEMLRHGWEKRARFAEAAAVMARLHRELPGEAEVWVMDARLAAHLGNRRTAAQSLWKACGLGLSTQRRDEVRQQTGVTEADWASVAGA